MREISWPLLIWSGMVGLVLSTWLLAVVRRVGATRYLPRAYWSCALFGGATDLKLLVAGTLRMAAMIVPIPLAYAALFAATGTAEALMGAVAGAIHGLLAGLLLPLAARRCPGAARPGVLGWNLGRLTPLILILIHAFYGAALGYIYVIPLP